jgi:hypothetical protein
MDSELTPEWAEYQKKTKQQQNQLYVVTPPNGLKCGHGHFSQEGKLDLKMVIESRI